MSHVVEPPTEHRASRRSRLRLLSRSDDGEARPTIALTQSGAYREEDAEAPIRMLIAAGHELVRASYRALVERDERIEVVATAANGRQAVALASGRAADVALLDLALPGLDDLDTAAGIVSDPVFERVPVMLIVPDERDERVLGVIRAGAVGVLSKDAEPFELIRAVKLLARGDAIFPAGLLRHLLAELPPQSKPRGPIRDQLAELTDREREVVGLVGTGLGNAEIAAKLVISPATAKTHVSRAMIKLDARNRAQLVVIAYATGLALVPPALTAPAAS
jgi:DNA-binding NarL/FixJ family response regulator